MSLGHNVALFAIAFQSVGKILSTLLIAKVVAAAALLGGLAQIMRNRRDFRIVAAMDDAQLRDIGLTPGDLCQARGVSLGRDPTAELARTVNERRR